MVEKQGVCLMKKIYAILITIATLAVLSGCGGGGGGSSVAPGAPSVKSGNGRAAFELHFSGRSAGRSAGATATGTVSITVTITGDYGVDGTSFPPVTASTQIDASGGKGTVSMLEIPIGVNHLMTAIATWQDGTTDTIKYIIPEIKEGELTKGVADYRTTVIADAAIALAERDKIKLSKVSKSQIDTIASAVDAFLAAGYTADEININDVLAYETTGNVPASIDVSPATATVLVGATAQFTATPKNTYGIAITGTVTWSVTGGIGTVNSNGLFTATAAGSGTVVATSETKSDSAAVTVTVSQVCGNGATESGETCDDGNTTTETCTYGQTSCTVCNSSCQSDAGATSYCGDSTTDGTNGETCDDGANNGQPNYCNATCDGMVPATCGNSVVESGETCDDGNTTTETCTYGQTSCTVCNSTCQSAAGAVTGYCGDSTTQTGNGETCDDGANNGVLNYCNANCDGYTPGSTNPWITVPAGDFVMGCATADGSCYTNESPKHTVTLPQYKIQKYEVTNAQYKACVTASACTVPSNANSYNRTPYYGNATYDNYPVIYVDWNKASTYCAWIGGRLPTEAEWEKAARGAYPAEPIYPWGDTTPTCTLAEFWNSCTGDTAEVGSHPTGASSYGVMDLAGNVWEWVNDWYDATYYTTGGPPWSDPQGAGSGTYRVLRGGTWFSDANLMRASVRIDYNPSYSDDLIGFRCAQD
ncbi:MAG: SUMF1/EgtB/PvdO family nonheme iron enzyme [bacterium]